MTSKQEITIAICLVGAFIIIPAVALANQEWATVGLSIIFGCSLIVILSNIDY